MNYMVLAAIGAGVCFSMLGVFGRAGIPRNIHLLHLSAVVGILGAAWLLPGALRDIENAGAMPPAFLLILGLANGLIRYFGIILWNRALVMGPLSLLACAVNLGFIVVVPYVWAVHGQTPSRVHWAAVTLAILAVLLAARSNASSRERDGGGAGKVGLAYLLILFGIWLLGGAGNVVIKEMDILRYSPLHSYLGVYGNVFWLCEYFSLGFFAAVDRAVLRSRPGQPFMTLAMGVIALAFAIVGFECLRLAISLPPAVYFSIANVTAIVFSVLIGTVIFREKRTIWWYLTVAASVAVVLLAGAGA